MDDLIRRAQLPDPCTLLFGVPVGAPTADGVEGREWTVLHWLHCARRQGHHGVPVGESRVDAAGGWCGDLELDGLVYQVHRGFRRRILAEYVRSDGTVERRFELAESVWVEPVWVEPVAPEPVPMDCAWCDDGPPDTLRDVGEIAGEDDGTHVIAVSEFADGGGRCIAVQLDRGEQDTYCVVLDPGQHTVYGGITECVVDGRTREGPQALSRRIRAEGKAVTGGTGRRSTTAVAAAAAIRPTG